MGALALTGQPAKADPFRPLPGDVTHVPFGDVDALAAGGDRRDRDGDARADPGRERRRRPAARLPGRGPGDHHRTHGALLALDEVQTGIGRTGHWFAHQADGVAPDVVTLAKGLGGGLPIGACLAFGARPTCSARARTRSTFGGNPVACAAALAVLETIAAENLLDHVKRIGERLRRGVEALGHPLVAGVRGTGLLLAIVLASRRSAAVVDRAAGARASWPTRCSPTRCGWRRRSILTAEQADAFLAALPAALDQWGRA